MKEEFRDRQITLGRVWMPKPEEREIIVRAHQIPEREERRIPVNVTHVGPKAPLIVPVYVDVNRSAEEEVVSRKSERKRAGTRKRP